MEPFQENDQVMMIKHCGHIFKPAELQSWFQTNVKCPVCRYDIRNYTSTNSRNSQQRQEQRTNRSATSQERNSRRQQPYRILRRGESVQNTELFNNLVTSIWNNAFVTDSSYNTL